MKQGGGRDSPAAGTGGAVAKGGSVHSGEGQAG